MQISSLIEGAIKYSIVFIKEIDCVFQSSGNDINNTNALQAVVENAYLRLDLFCTDSSLNVNGCDTVKQSLKNSFNLGTYNSICQQNAYAIYFSLRDDTVSQASYPYSLQASGLSITN